VSVGWYERFPRRRKKLTREADRNIIVMKTGRIVLHRSSSPVDGWNLPTVLDISSRLVTDGELGLLGCAVDPAFNSGRNFVYLTYSLRQTKPATAWGTQIAQQRISRFTYNTQTNTIDVNSEVVLFGACNSVDDCIPVYRNFHAGGALKFGPDGKLYYATGDGQLYEGLVGAAYVPNPSWVGPQELSDPNGKVFRLNPDNGQGLSDNPFFDGNVNSLRSRIHSYGYRNPWTIAFDKSGARRVYVYQVGWFSKEGIISARPGTNAGWPCFELDQQAPQPWPAPAQPFCSTSSIVSTTRTVFSTATTLSSTLVIAGGVARMSTVTRFSTATMLQPTSTVQMALHPRYNNYNPNLNVLMSYATGASGGGSIIGAGYFPSQFPTWWRDRLFGADFVRGNLWWWDPAVSKNVQTQQTLGRNALQTVKMVPSARGTLLLLQYDNGGSIREMWFDDSTISGGCAVPNGYTRTTAAPVSPTVVSSAPAQTVQPRTTTTQALPTGRPGPNGMIYTCDAPRLYPLALTPLTPGLDTQMHISDSGLFTCNTNSLGPCEFDSNNGGAARGDGSPITLARRRYQKGISGRAPFTGTVAVNNMCTKFEAVIGLDDTSRGQGWGEWLVVGDGRILYNSTQAIGSVLIPRLTPRTVSVNIAGVRSLQLRVVRPYGFAVASNNMSLVDWADAMVWCGPNSRFVPTVKLWPTVTSGSGALSLPGGLKMMNLTGQTVHFGGQAQDYTGAFLPASSLSWSVDIVHCQGALCHQHPGMFTFSGTDRISFSGVAHQDCIWWKVSLTARDSCGRASVATYQIAIREAEPFCYTGLSGGFNGAKAQKVAQGLGISTQSLQQLASGKVTVNQLI
jgi:hypothetical protein